MELVEASIKTTVEAKIESVEAAFSGGPPYFGITDSGVLLKKKQLHKKEEELRKVEEQLREKEEQLLEKLLFTRRGKIEDSVPTSGKLVHLQGIAVLLLYS